MPKLKKPQVYRSEEVDQAMKDAALCPFCGASQGTNPLVRLVRYELRLRGEKWFYVSCWLCGAEGAKSQEPLEAIRAWNARPTPVWTPLGPHTYLLDGVQKYSHLMVHDGGDVVTLFDYIEQEVSPNKDGIQAKQDLHLGRFRICDKR